MTKALVSWVGNKDLEGAGAQPVSGPLARILAYQVYDVVYLLHDQNPKQVKQYLHRLKAEFQHCQFNLQPCQLQSPVHFGDIYKALDTCLAGVSKQQPHAELYIQLSSGTSAMASVSILAGKTKYPAKFIQSSKEQGVQAVDIPFDIAADFLPAVATAWDERLSHLMAGEAPSTAEFDNIISKDPQMCQLKQRAAVLAAREVPILIHGASGTGKELFARAIHNSSPRANKPFLPLNCGAIPADLIDSTLFGHIKGAFTGAAANKKGVFAEADGGTLFLDEFGELPPNAQVRLLRVLQDGSYLPVGGQREQYANVRIIVATNKNLPEEIAAGRFREDLYYRVAIGVIHLPSLSARKGDKWLLAEHLMQQINREAASQPGYKHKKISAAAKKVILQHHWPGNVRELYATLLRASLWGHSSAITGADIRDALLESPRQEPDILSRELSQGIDIEALLDEVKMHYTQRALEESGGVKKKASELLGMSNYQRFSGWMNKYGIK